CPHPLAPPSSPTDRRARVTVAARQIDERPFTVPTLAARWECSEGLIRKMIERGELRSFRIGVLIRIPADEVTRIECQSLTASNDCEAPLPSSGKTEESDGDDASMPRIGRARRPRPGEFGKPGTIHLGPWAG